MKPARINYALALCAAVGAAVLGALMAPSIPSAVFPEIVFPRAIILASNGELPREQMLVAVTRPLEEAAYGVAGTSLVRSTTTRGEAEIDVTFSSGTELIGAFQLLNSALSEARAKLPPGTSFDTRLLTTGTFPVLDLSLSSRIRGLPELTDIAFYDLLPSFHRIPGVYRVELVGGKYREYVVRLDPARMLARGLSPQQVAAGLSTANVVASPGRLLDSHRMLLTVVLSNLQTREELERVPIASAGGQPVHVRDVGSVELGVREDYIRAACERGPAVLVGISRQPGGDIELIARQARELVERFKRRYPDVDFSFSYDQSALVRESFQSVRDAILLGLGLAFLTVLGFTLSPISAVVALLVVGLCVLSTMAIMKACGLTFNMMTLGGLAAGIGLFIDDAIVMIEAIHRQRAAGLDAEAANQASIGALTRPLIASTFTVIVVFVPLVFLPALTGTFFRALAITLSSGLAISLLLALYLTPALELFADRLRGRAREPGRIFAMVRSSYIAVFRPFVRFPAAALGLGAAALGVAALLLLSVGTDYLPAMDEGAFVLDYNTPPQSTLADTTSLLKRLEAVLLATPEVWSFARRTGTQLGFFLTESNRGDISVRLRSHRRRDIEQIMNSIRNRIQSSLPGVRIEFSQLLQDLLGDLSGTPKPIEVKVLGADQAAIEATARRVAAELRGIPGLVDVFDGVVISNPEQRVAVDTTAAERFGISAQDVRATLQTVIEGTVATSVRTGDRLIGVRVRYPERFHRDLSALSGVLLMTPADGAVPLSAVAALQWAGEPSQLDRERLSPVVRVTARLSGLDLGDAVALVRNRLSTIALPAGLRLELGGLYAQQQSAFAGLALVLIAGAAAVLLVLLWEFARLGPALAVLLGAIPCLAGGLIGLAATGITLNISSFMGAIMVVGIAAKNGILLLDRAEHLAAAGETTPAALIEAARARIRPILMTTIATVAGLLPLALGLGAGAKIQQPLAVVVIGGLLFSMLFSIPLAGGAYALWTRSSRTRSDSSG